MTPAPPAPAKPADPTYAYGFQPGDPKTPWQSLLTTFRIGQRQRARARHRRIAALERELEILDIEIEQAAE